MPTCPLPGSPLGGTFSTSWESQEGDAEIGLELEQAEALLTVHTCSDEGAAVQ